VSDQIDDLKLRYVKFIASDPV